MKVPLKKLGISLMSALLAAGLLAGCKEPSEKDVASSSYYKELEERCQKLKKQNKKLKEEAQAKEGISVDEKRAADYLDKIARDSLMKLEAGYADDMDHTVFVEDKAVFSAATAIAKRADLTAKYTPEQVAAQYGPGYEYILYDEDNAIYEIMVYGGDYIVFNDLPNNVYYAYHASALGDAFLHYRDRYPNSSLLHRLADAPLVTNDKGSCYENDAAVSAANFIDTMEKKKSSRAAAEKYWKKKAGTAKMKTNSSAEAGASYEPESRAYTFYHHGNKLTLTLYDRFVCIENMDGDRTWYKVKKTAITELKEIFKDRKLKVAEKNDGSGPEKEQSHSEEIEEESSPSDS